MKKSGWTLTVAAIVVGLSGTMSGVVQDKIPEIPKLQPAAAKSMTVAGCVGKGTTADTYVLTNLTRDGEPAVKDASKTETLVLSGSDVDMSKHVGHQVSVTGLHAATDYSIGTMGVTDVKPGTPSTMTRTGAKASTAFTVKSLAMISATCSKAGD